MPISLALVEQARLGHRESQDLLIRQHLPSLLGHARQVCGDPLLAQDICQRACVKLLPKLSSLLDPEWFVPWARAFIRHEAHNVLRSARRRHPTVLCADAGANTAAPDHPQWATGDLDRIIVLLRKPSARMTGPTCQIAAFMLHHYAQDHEFPTVRAIAEATHLTLGSAQRGLGHVMLRWRRCLVAAGLQL